MLSFVRLSTKLTPWALIKEDKEAAGKVLAHSALYALCLGVALKPFLPELSGSILEHFEKRLTPESVQSIYKGDLEVLNSMFADGHTLENEVVALVPKIDDEQIKARLEELASL